MQDWRDFSCDDLAAPLRAARELFAIHGYHGTSIRAIADSAGLSVPGLYHHYPSKQVILDALVTHAMNQMLTHTRAADAASDGSPDGRFGNVVEALLRFHMERRDDAFVASTEMRSMDEPVLKAHVAQRDMQQRLVREIIEQGAATGAFACRHPTEAARAVASLCVSVADWYRPDGPLSAEQIVDRYGEFARRIIGADVDGIAPRPE
ncbi:helix-turn-helix transcriptional regulator [Rhodococcus sp. D2-41]|nr:TetR/AcrR family transcriptional regulator [Rhodococcus sp. D2-41]MDG3010153.1 helix-turn-helix transcriptional regulator [Rhodococcus sp. D2-41]